MKIFLLTASLIIAVFITSISAQQFNYPKREFRGIWVASVANLDWPSSPFLTTDQQKKELLNILDGLKNTNVNAVIFQIRSECDAMYKSNLEPWSYWLTGEQGKAPDPYYDPLEFAVEEVHKRGMEIHAWFNPYRAVRSDGSYTISSQHISVQHPDWILQFGNLKILDPGLPMVRDYVTSVIMDVVRRYDIDGVHFDDYFYPYEGISNEDDASYANYNRGFTNKGDWRRDNVNLFVEEVNDSIKAVKPYIKFGISPFGIWKNGVPSGITGLDAYNVLYADPIAWLQKHTVDYLTPQLYWKFGGSQDYGKLMPWWADSAGKYNRHLYPGLAAYHIGDAQNWPPSELLNQIKANRNEANAQGSVFFRALVGVLDNEKGFEDSLKNNTYKYPALLPEMNWKDSIKPNTPLNLKFSRIALTGRAGLNWDLPETASDGDSATRYIIYRFNTQTPQQTDYNNAENIFSVVNQRINFPASSESLQNYFFSVTAVDRNYNESLPGNVVEIAAPQTPVLAVPFNNEANAEDTLYLKWNYTNGASFYRLQVSLDSSFAQDFLFDDNLTDTVKLIAGMAGQTKYFWRVKAFNIAGASNFSQIFNFTTGFPQAPVLLDPPYAELNVSLNPTLKWMKSAAADNYRLQISRSPLYNDQTIILDTSGIADTLYNLENLNSYTTYYWRVSAVNQYGTSNWPSTFGFKTEQVLEVQNGNKIPKEFILFQNFPNPFNPTTKIKFGLPRSSFVNLKIYNLLGQEVITIVNGFRKEGYYNITFNASNLPSGIYIYRLVTEKYSSSKKMILLK